MAQIFVRIGLILVFIFQAHAQVYNFNRKLIYEVTDLKDNKNNHNSIFYVNDQNNNYNAYVSDEKLSELVFTDQNGPLWKANVNLERLNNIKVKIEKTELLKFQNPYKYQVNNYDFTSLKDTILNGKLCKQFMLKSIDPKREKRKGVKREIYVIDTTQNIKPVFIFCTAYEIWKLKHNPPNGLIVEKYLLNNRNELLIKEKLKSSEDINLIFDISRE